MGIAPIRFAVSGSCGVRVRSGRGPAGPKGKAANSGARQRWVSVKIIIVSLDDIGKPVAGILVANDDRLAAMVAALRAAAGIAFLVEVHPPDELNDVIATMRDILKEDE